MEGPLPFYRICVDQNETWAWLGGWGLPSEMLHEHLMKVSGDFRHIVRPPTAEALQEIIARVRGGEIQNIGGYSLGSLLLLSEWGLLSLSGASRGFFVAPFFAFLCEKDSGGRVSLAELSRLSRVARKNMSQALGAFAQFTGMAQSAQKDLPYQKKDLLWGAGETRFACY